MVNEAIRTGYPKVIQLIFGKIYGNGWLFRVMYEMSSKRGSAIIGRGDNFIPNIYAGDAAASVIAAMEKLPVGEKFIIADDNPVTQKDFSLCLAELINGKRPRHIPAFFFKLIIGKDFYEVIRMNCKVSNEKAKRILGWQPQYPSYKEGLKETIRQIRKEKNYFS